MNSKFCLSAIHLLFVLLIACIGTLLCLIAYLPSVRFLITDLIIHRSYTVLQTGLVFLGCAVLTFIGFYIMHRKRYLQIKMKTGKVAIDEAVALEYLQNYWNEVFPKKQISTEVVFHSSGKLEVIADLPLEKLEKPEILLHRIQNELGVLLSRRLGYEKEFLLTVS